MDSVSFLCCDERFVSDGGVFEESQVVSERFEFEGSKNLNHNLLKMDFYDKIPLSLRKINGVMAKDSYKIENEAFLVEVAKDPEVKALPKGIFYKVIGYNALHHSTPPLWSLGSVPNIRSGKFRIDYLGIVPHCRREYLCRRDCSRRA